jgi:RNA polymerase sigma-70 factor, ECF subfamily
MKEEADGRTGAGLTEADTHIVALLESMRDGDPAAFEAFFHRYQRVVFGTALGLVGDPATAEEIVCDVFLRAYGSRASLDPARSPVPWLQRVTVNLSISHLRRRRFVTSPIDDLLHGALPRATPGPLERRETELYVESCLARLPVALRAVLALRYLLDLSVAEIATILEEPPTTVKHRIRLGLTRLRLELAEEEADRPVRPTPQALRGEPE